VAGCCKYGDEPSGSGATELVYIKIKLSRYRHAGDKGGGHIAPTRS
jgi:hypothetical protein